MKITPLRTQPLDSNSLLKRLWRSTSLSSHEFANEVAAFFGLRKMTLSELTEFRSLADRFAPRFLRDASIFPFETGDGTISLAAGDPADAEALRAAEIVLGEPFEIVTASFDDIATVLGDKLEADEAAGGGRESGAGRNRRRERGQFARLGQRRARRACGQ